MKRESESAEFFRRPAVRTLLALLCCLLWGSAFPCIKIELVSVKIDSVSLKERLTYEKFN